MVWLCCFEIYISITSNQLTASIQASKTLSQKETPRLQGNEATALPQGVKLHKMPEAPKNSRDERKDTPKEAKFDFGVKLKVSCIKLVCVLCCVCVCAHALWCMCVCARIVVYVCVCALCGMWCVCLWLYGFKTYHKLLWP